MSITINSIRENENDQTVFVTIEYGGNDYEFHGDTPIMNETNTLAFVKKHKEKYLCLIIGKMYPSSDWKRFKNENNTNFEAVKKWIQEGHKNLIDEDESGSPIYKVIDKIPFRSTHPHYIKWEAQIEAATTVSQLKTILKKIVRRIS